MLDKDTYNGSEDNQGKPLNATASVSVSGYTEKKLDPKGIKKCYVYLVVLCVVMGSIQFGLVLGGWGILQNIYCAKMGWNISNWDDEDQRGKECNSWKTIITTIQNVALVITSFIAPFFLKYGKRKTMIYNTILCFIGSAFSVLGSVWSLCLGRFICGVSAGYFALVCPKFINETVPIEMKGAMGSMVQLALTFGILLPSLLVIGYVPEQPEYNPLDTTDYDNYVNSFAVQHYYQIVFGLPPLVIGIMQIVMFFAVCPYETPLDLKKKPDWDKLREFMHRLYQDHQVVDRIDAIVVEEKKDPEDVVEVSYKETFTSPMLKKAAYVAVLLGAFQQLCGINAIIFYSASIFEQSGFNNPNASVTIVNAANFISAIPPVFFLNYVGRRTAMLVCCFFMTISLVFMGVATLNEWSTAELLFTILFVVLFEFSTGPITWLYIAEVTNDKGASAATFVLQFFTLLFGLITLYLFDGLGGYTFIIFGIFAGIETLFLFFVVKETKGLSEAQVAKLYVNQKDLDKLQPEPSTEELLS